MSDVSSVFGTSHLIYHISYVGRANTNVLFIRSVGKPLKEVHDVYWGSWRSCDSFAQFFGALGSYCWRTMTLSNTIPAEKQDFIHLCLTYPRTSTCHPWKMDGWKTERLLDPFCVEPPNFSGFFPCCETLPAWPGIAHNSEERERNKGICLTVERYNMFLGIVKHKSFQRGRHKIIYSLNCVYSYIWKSDFYMKIS